jgi:hypothetical protein
MRFRLRTLLIVLAMGPPLMAGVWLLLQLHRGPTMLVTIAACVVSVAWFWVRRRELADHVFKR